MLSRGWADGREGAGKRWSGRSDLPPSPGIVTQRRVQALGLMARTEQVAAASAASVVAVRRVAPATTAGEAAVVGVTGMRGGAAGLGVIRRRRGLVGRNGRQSEKVRELQVALV